MYRPEKAYKISITDNPESSDFSVWFSDDPDELTTFLFQAMGLEQTLKNQKEFKASGEKERAFAELMQICLPQGEFPIKIPYVPPRLTGEAGITSMFHSIASFKYNNAFGKKQEQDILIFERKSSRRNGYAGILARTLFNVGKEGFTVSARANKTKAEDLFSKDFVQTKIVEPFGFFDADLIIKKEKLETEKHSEAVDETHSENELENEVDLTLESSPIESEEVNEKSDEGTHLTSVSPNEGTDTTSVAPILKSLVDTELADDGKHTMLVTPLEETQVKDVSLDKNEVEETVEKTEETAALEKVQDDTSEEQILRDNYFLLNKLAHDFKKAFQQGSNFSESQSTESKFKTIRIQQKSEVENDLVDVALELTPNKKGSEEKQSVSLRIHLKEKEAIVTQWNIKGTDEEVNQAKFSELIENLLYDGHLFELWENRSEQQEQTLNTATSEKKDSDKSPIESISITENKSNIEDFQVFSSWAAANDWLAKRNRLSDKETTIYYSIKWNNNKVIASNFQLFSEHFHPQYETKVLQKATVFAILNTQYRAEGRYKGQAKDAVVKKNSSKLDEILDLVDLGNQVDNNKQIFQPKIPVTSLAIKSSLIPLMVKTYKEGQEFEQANDLIIANKTSRGSEDSIEISGVWKDGTQLETTVKLKSIPTKPNSAFWQTIIASFTTDPKTSKYQTADGQPLLFSHELPSPKAKFYYKNLLAAYWYSSDSDTQEKIQFQGYSFHRTELSQLIQQYLNQLEEEDENDLIELSKSSPRWKIVVNFLIDYKKLRVNDSNLQQALITQMLDDAVESNDERSKTALSGLLIRIRDGETLKDLPAKRLGQSLKSKSQTKAEDSRIKTNRAIEQLLSDKGTDVLKYSSDELTLIEKYSGYGGSKLSEINKGLLYEYYTPDEIIQFMWGFAFKHGYSNGAVLEPSCGIGKFLKYVPKHARIEGYEINKHSARIAQLLYPKAKIHNKSFEQLFFNGNIYLKGNFRTDPFQLVIGNPPYGSFSGKFAGMGEKKRTKAFTYDQYFLTRGLDLLSSGGLLIFIIPQSFLDNGSKYMTLKERIANKSEFLEARRLPHGIFEHTEVGTDIVVFRKK
ncbi:MAG: N-6 DNA methylase [Vicingaceae bacterium]